MNTDRLSNIIQVYLEGELELDTAVAELTHVYVEHGWGFYLVEAECYPEHRQRMRTLASRMEAAVRATEARQRRGLPMPAGQG
jgi:hypothetical protein